MHIVTKQMETVSLKFKKKKIIYKIKLDINNDNTYNTYRKKCQFAG